MTGLISPLELVPEDQPQPTPTETALAAPTQTEPTDDLSLVRELVLKAHPDVVPELIGGESVPAILASITPAQAAYSGLAARLQSRAGAPEAVGGTLRVPAGGSVSAPVDLDRLPPAEKLRRGLRDRTRRSDR